MNIFKRKNDEELEKLAQRVTELTRITHLNKASKKQLKSRLMGVIHEKQNMKEYQGLVSRIQELAQTVCLSSSVRESMRRRVLNYISLDLGSFSFVEVGFSNIFRRSVWATAMIFVISFVSIFTFDLNTPIAHAKDSRLVNVEGDVYVYRDGMLQAVTADEFVLYEGDKIHTGYRSSVTAIFMDDTVSRIAGESELNLRTLYVNPEQPSHTEVTLGVKEGRVWSRVHSLLDGSFNVATLHTLTKAERNATFDVRADRDDVEVSVVENFVDVELSSYSPAVKTTVVQGESLVVSGDKSAIVHVDSQDEWVRMNISKDEFESQLLAQEDSEQREESVGALPTDKMYGVKTFKENLGVVLSINERERLQNQIRIAQKRLAEAELLVKQGLTGNAEKVLKEYKQIMLALSHEYPDLIGIEEVEEELSEMIAQDKRRYYTTLPGSSLYDVKEVVDEVELLLVNDRVRANQIALNQASDSLYQVFDLIDHGGEVIAEDSLDGYIAILDSVFVDLEYYEQVDRDGYVYAALDTALSDLKTLNALGEVLIQHDSMLHVKEVRDQLVARLTVYIELVPNEEFYEIISMEFENLKQNDFDILVNASEFTGISEENAATLDVALDEVEDDMVGR